MVAMMLQALVLPRTTILLLLFLTAFIWIAVSNHLQSNKLSYAHAEKPLFLISITIYLKTVTTSTYLAGDLDAAAGRAPALHHLGPLALLPPPARHHHLLHHPHLHDGPGQRGKCSFLTWLQGTPWHLVFQFDLMMAGLNAKL